MYPRSATNYGDEASGSLPIPWSTVTDGSADVGVNYRSGVDLPRYLSIIQSGGDATTDFSACKYLPPVVKQASYRMQYTKANKGNQVFTRGFTGNLTCQFGWNEDSATYNSSDNLALGNLYKRIADAQSNFDGLVFVGELSETVAMLKSPLTRLRSRLSDYLQAVIQYYRMGRNRPFSVRKANGWLEQTWLEVSFGMRPLISDISGIMEALETQANSRRRTRFMATGSSTTARERHSSLTRNSCPYAYRIVLTTVSSTRLFVGMTPDFGKPLNIGQAWGFRPERFVPTVYELLPWSWLVDYFSNVGSIVESLSYFHLRPSYICRTRKAVRTKSFTSWPTPEKVSDKIVSISGDAGSSVSVNVLLARTQLKELAVPSIEVKLPHRWDQWVNLAAVAAQRTTAHNLFKRLI